MAGTLEGRRLLVTGASSGIGRAIAAACRAEGAAVAGLARRADRLADLEAEHGVVPVVGDVADLAGVRGLVDGAAAALGGLDGVVAAAGIMRPGLIADADPEDWRAMVEVNVLGLLATVQASIPHLRAAGGGSIVPISSMSGRRVPSPMGGTYAATKHAVHAIAESLRQELQGEGVRVTTIAPGFVDTEIFEVLDDGPLKDRYQRLASAVGMRAEDVAAAVVHALSAPASVTTVEIAMVPTGQDDGAYADQVGED